LTKFKGHLILGVPKEIVGAAIFGLASLTDWLDGYLARRRQQITTLGQVIDPLADKLLISAALISLVAMDLAPAWMVAIIIGREFLVTGLRSIAYARGVAIAASPLGKIKMIAQVVAVLALILSPGQPMLLLLGQGALWVVVAAALVSAADYFRRFNTVLSSKVADVPLEPPGSTESVVSTATSAAPRSRLDTRRPAPTQSSAPTSSPRS
jgi:CDP-diacylglycerol--glycerol-3-phosphate 3-phosphatidyltransferase